MSTLWFDNVRIVRPGIGIDAGGLLVAEGIISRLNPPAGACPPDACRIDGQGCLLTPGLIDLHTHGLAHYQFDNGPDDVRAALKLLPAFGTTSILPTLVPVVGPTLLSSLDALATVLQQGTAGAVAVGLHLEGPFVALSGAGCETVVGDLVLLDELIHACHGLLRLMSISPETPGILPVIERLCERGILPCMTHTRASVEEAQAAIAAGATHATHFYDVFPVPNETDPGVRPVGVVEAVLADPAVTVDFIADGTHVHPVAIRAALAAKGTDGVALITDANIGAGLPDGEYDTPWGFRIHVSAAHGARIVGDHPKRGALAGSALTMDQGMRNLMRWLPLPAEQIWTMGTRTPARRLGLDRKGVIAEGADADLVLWDEALTPLATWIAGEQVWRRAAR